MARAYTIPDEVVLEEDSLIECGICLSEIDNPKALPCLHSFCLTCLRNIKQSSGVLTCPLCQEQIPLPAGGVDDFRNNFFINQLKERRAICRMGAVKAACICCGATDHETVARCVDCNGFLCQQCVDLHKKIVPLQIHTVFTVAELRSGNVDLCNVMKEECCQRHKDQVVRFFCKKCEIPICRDCTVVDHRYPDHDHVALESVTKDLRLQINELADNCKQVVEKVATAISKAEKVEKELTESIAEASRQLDGAKDEDKKCLLKTLDENYISLYDELHILENEKRGTINSNKAYMRSLQAKLNNAVDIANHVIKSGSSHDVASNYTSLSGTLKQLQDAQFACVEDYLSVVKFSRRTSAQTTMPLGKILGYKAKAWVLQKEIGKDGEDKLSNAHAVAIALNGDIVVTEWDSPLVRVYNSNGDFKSSLKLAKKSHLCDTAVGPAGEFYVVDKSTYVKVYSALGKYLKKFPAKSSNGTPSDVDNSQLCSIEIDNENCMFVGSSKPYISKHKQDGTHVSTIKVSIPPNALALTSNGLIVVSPCIQDACVHVIGQTGSLLHTIKAPNDILSWYPNGVCCSNDDVIYLNSYDNGNEGGVYSFTVEGEYLGCVTKDVTYAEGLAFTSDVDDKLVVVQCYGHPVKMFSYK